MRAKELPSMRKS